MFVPRRTVHAFSNTGGVAGRLLVTVTPGFEHEQLFLRAGLDRHFREHFFAWRPYLHRYSKVNASQENEQAMIDTEGINALAFRYIGAPRREASE